MALQNCLNKKINDIGDKPDDYTNVHIDSKADIDAVNTDANVGKFVDKMSEQRKAGVDASSEVATHVYYGCDESVACARRKNHASKRIPINLCQHKKCKGICIMRSTNQYGDKKKKEEKTHPKGFWRRLLERVSCFGHYQSYEDKHARIGINIENIHNRAKCLVDVKSRRTTITAPNNNSY